MLPCPVMTTARASERRSSIKRAAIAFAEFNVERIGLAVPQRHHRNAVDSHNLDHDLYYVPAGFAGMKFARCHSRSACMTATVNTRIAST